MLQIRFDLDALTRDFTDLEKRQVPFAFAQAANDATLEAQRATRASQMRALNVRTPKARAEFERAILFNREGRADSKAGKLTAELRIIGQPGFAATTPRMARVGRILIRQEQGGTSTGGEMVRRGRTMYQAGHLIPFEGLRGPNKAMSKALYPTSIGLSPRRRISGGEEFASQYKGGAKKRGGFKKGTKFYFATDKGIFVREQVGKESEYDGVWWFKKRITLRPTLSFEPTYLRVTQERLPLYWVQRLEGALRTAR